MKTMIVRENTRGRERKVHARSTYQTDFGTWIAEVDGREFRDACKLLCEGLTDCRCDDLHVEADQDDDGKEYRILSN